MFNVEGTTITLSRGDTGALRIKANATRADTGEPFTFGERDRALFSIKNGNTLVREKAYPMVNNAFVVVFTNQDTQNLQAGSGYTWDIRYSINPYYEEEPPEGPWPDYSELTFPVTKNTKCMHGGTYYIAKQDIPSSEEWTQGHWFFADYRHPADGAQIITPNTPMGMNMLNVVGEI